MFHLDQQISVTSNKRSVLSLMNVCVVTFQQKSFDTWFDYNYAICVDFILWDKTNDNIIYLSFFYQT